MLIVLDEWFHFDELPVNKSCTIKPVKVGRKHHSLQEALKTVKPGWLPKRLKLRKYDLNEELEFMLQSADNNQRIVYFYEPRYTDVGHLHRIRNWLQPDKQVYPIPVYGNRAEVPYLINNMTEWLNEQHDVTYKEMLAYTDALKDQVIRVMITPEPVKLIDWKKSNAIYRLSSKQQYCLISMGNEQNMKQIEPGELTDLWNNVVEGATDDQEIWAVCKGIPVDLARVDHLYRVGEPLPPVNIPFVHAVVTPKGVEQQHKSA